MAPIPVEIQPVAPDAGHDEIELDPDLDCYVEHPCAHVTQATTTLTNLASTCGKPVKARYLVRL